MNRPPTSWLDEVDVAVVSHNGRTTLPRVFTCLGAAGVPADRISLYDIASTDGTAAWLAEAWPAARVVRLPTNDGPNPARNQALADATRPWLLLVDADAYLRPEAGAALWDAARSGDTRVGAVVPIVVHDRDPGRIQYAGGRLHFLCEASSPWADHPVADRGAGVAEIGTAPGVCLLLRTDAARRIGGFDSRYFMGKEDGEFCFRLRLAGYRVLETPAALVEHASRPRSTWLFPFQIRNRWHFLLKNYEGRTLLVLLPALLVHEPLQALLLVAKGEGAAWWRALRELPGFSRGLATDRARVRALRVVHDRALLTGDPLVVRSDLAGGGVGRAAKRAYDTWLAWYWRLASPLLP
jgi:GT2 family glycosyltransferase